MTPQNPRRQPAHPQIDEAMICALVQDFYTRVREDEEIGPIFARVIGQDWDSHLAKMCDFWSSVMLLTGRYKGNPMLAHMRQKLIRPEHFARWLTLFQQSARAICPSPIAELFISRAQTIARSLQLGMFYRPGETPEGGPPPS